MKAEELKAVLENLYGEVWCHHPGNGLIHLIDGAIDIYYDRARVFIRKPEGISNKEYRELTRGLTPIKGFQGNFNFDDSVVIKLSPLVSYYEEQK